MHTHYREEQTNTSTNLHIADTLRARQITIPSINSYYKSNVVEYLYSKHEEHTCNKRCHHKTKFERESRAQPTSPLSSD